MMRRRLPAWVVPLLAPLAIVALLAIARAVVQRAWGGPTKLRAAVNFSRLRGADYDRAIAATARASGAPRAWVRYLYPSPAYVAPCIEERPNPWRIVAAVAGSVVTAVVTVIAPPAGVAVGAVTGVVTGVQPKTVMRPCAARPA